MTTNPPNKNPSKTPVPKGIRNTAPAPKGATPEYPSWLNGAIVCGILVVTFICYHYTLSNKFTNWDDGVYIYENPYVKNLSSANLKMLLFHDITQNYYHPITMLSLALNYHFWGMNPQPYYITEIILHLLNTAWAFLLSLALLNAMVKKGYGKIKGIQFWAGLCGLWQGIHPMHVESVSWIAERKDVLYLFFYLPGMLMYVKYLMEGKKSHYVLTVLLFIFSLFSKPLAVVFPLSLLAIDILLKRDKEFAALKDENKFVSGLIVFGKLLINKIPFFVVSLIFGYIAYTWAKEGGSISSFATFTKFQRITFVGSNYLMYLYKLFVPTFLCSYYPYPELDANGYMPFFFYAAPFLAVGITGLLIWLAYKKGGENYFRVTLFGFAYYLFNVMFILQFVSAGPAIMADRYSYAAYFGFVFMLIFFIYTLVDKLPVIKYPVYVLLTVFSIMLGYLCEARTRVWHSTQTLWEDVIAKYPLRVETSYKNLGNYYVQDKNPPDYDSAYMNFEVLEKIHSKDAGVYSNIGNIWAIRGDYKKSLDAYTHSLKLDSTGSSNFDTYLDRGITYSKMEQYDLALKDFNHADKLKPNCQALYENRGYVYLNGVKIPDSAIADYTRLIAIDPTRPDYFLNKGIAEFNKDDFKDAITDFRKNISIDSKSLNGIFNLSLAYKNVKDYKQAIVYATKAQKMGYKLPDNFITELQTLAKTQRN